MRAQSSLADYSREAFGPAWSDEGTVELSHNQYPIRQDLLARDLDDVVRAADGCTVVSGVLHNRYTAALPEGLLPRASLDEARLELAELGQGLRHARDVLGGAADGDADHVEKGEGHAR
ncbi:hypothetical protein [Streptomyces sp. NBC_00829]|uniref:hypothetical protein n=1 Tax=Streptomyces sp. NBC_00829 TaxID=2903679 RepID=UPI00386AAB56|nr:hypothetical protein OG293_40515 [Streptomyces sp. NBC_00829]